MEKNREEILASSEFQLTISKAYSNHYGAEQAYRLFADILIEKINTLLEIMETDTIPYDQPIDLETDFMRRIYIGENHENIIRLWNVSDEVTHTLIQVSLFRSNK